MRANRYVLDISQATGIYAYISGHGFLLGDSVILARRENAPCNLLFLRAGPERVPARRRVVLAGHRQRAA